MEIAPFETVTPVLPDNLPSIAEFALAVVKYRLVEPSLKLSVFAAAIRASALAFVKYKLFEPSLISSVSKVTAPVALFTDSTPPPTSAHAEPLYISGLLVVVLNLNCPCAAVGLCAVVPTGICIEPVVLMIRLPVIVPPASGSFVAILFVTVVLKLASSPIAAANSLSVFSALGELSTRAAISCCTKAVEAIVVSLSPELAVATVIVFPVKSRVLFSLAAVIALSAIYKPGTVVFAIFYIPAFSFAVFLAFLTVVVQTAVAMP